ncbi:hypothetical protein J2794_003548 [Paraburkholderia terricola]|uniref:hypothetical protein n=1 Tax=Paraburkholderia terricola TaxID=169427 RepID=UPI00285FBD69|nr:hypothetical protein [Paraburkholderia terricola]MDR6447432.1 hypothetical protein [Paraburkholderia terricola]
MDSREMYLVMAYGETPMPEVQLVFTLDEAFNAVVRMVYGDPSPSELLEARADFCDFEERVRDGFEWHAKFEIGGIRAWKVCASDDVINALAGPVEKKAAQAEPVTVALSKDELDALVKERFGNMHSMYQDGFRRLLRDAIVANAEKARVAPQLAKRQVALTDDARDAARYRWLTKHAYVGECNTYEGAVLEVFGTGRRVAKRGSIGEAIDAAIAAAQPAHGVGEQR